MAVIHIFKDGTKTTELKNVYVPKEVVKKVASLVEAQKKKGEQHGH